MGAGTVSTTAMMLLQRGLRRENLPVDLTQPDPRDVRAAGGGGDPHLVVVVQPGAGAAVGQRQRLGAVPGQLEQAAALVPVLAADRAGREQVAGPGAGPV